jgi:hypothetical protein
MRYIQQEESLHTMWSESTVVLELVIAVSLPVSFGLQEIICEV